MENSAYFDVIHNISKRFALRYGLRFNQFLRFKQNGLNSYLNDNPVEYDSNLGIYKGAESIVEFNINKNTLKAYGNI